MCLPEACCATCYTTISIRVPHAVIPVIYDVDGGADPTQKLLALKREFQTERTAR